MDANSIVTLLDMMGSMQGGETGTNINFQCPFRSTAHASGTDRTPSFTVAKNPLGKSLAFCFSCGVKGSLFSIAKEYEQTYGTFGLVDYVVDHENDDFSWYKKNQKDPKVQATFGYRKLASMKFKPDEIPGLHKVEFDEDNVMVVPDSELLPYASSIPKYVVNRGVTMETAKAFRLGYDQRRGAVLIPIIDRLGRLVGITRNHFKGTGPKYQHSKGLKKTHFLFGEHMIDKSLKDVVITEGHFDVINLWQAGYNALGTMGSYTGEVQLNKIVDALGLKGIAYLLPDNDQAGWKLKAELIAGLKDRVKVIDRQLLMEEVAEGKDAGDLTVEEMRVILDGCVHR